MLPEGNGPGPVYARVSLNDLDVVAESLLAGFRDYRIWIFHGDMGAGKTTLIKRLGHLLHVEDVMNSPTFSIVNEYHTGSQEKVYHMDFYRIRSEAEAFEIGVEEYFYSGSYCFIEWPDRIPSLVPERRLDIRITPEDNEHRTIAISIHDGKEKIRI